MEWRAAERELSLITAVQTTHPRHGIDDTEKSDGAERRRCEHGHDRPLRTEGSADERHERHVAKPHRFALQRHFAEPTDDRDHSCTGARADQRIVRSGEGRDVSEEERDDRGGERPTQPEEREAVGNEIGLEIGDGDAEQNGAKDRDPHRGEGGTERCNRCEPPERNGELDCGIHG